VASPSESWRFQTEQKLSFCLLSVSRQVQSSDWGNNHSWFWFFFSHKDMVAKLPGKLKWRWELNERKVVTVSWVLGGLRGGRSEKEAGPAWLFPGRFPLRKAWLGLGQRSCFVFTERSSSAFCALFRWWCHNSFWLNAIAHSGIIRQKVPWEGVSWDRHSVACQSSKIWELCGFTFRQRNQRPPGWNR
jgi:hypothetical protein